MKGAFAVILSDSKVNGTQKTLDQLDPVLHSVGFVRHNWDYQKATFDVKMQDPATGTIYYLRLLAHIVSGDMEKPSAVLKLTVPVIGRHIFPHGLDYRSDVPAKVAEQAKGIIASLEAKLGLH